MTFSGRLYILRDCVQSPPHKIERRWTRTYQEQNVAHWL